MIPNLFSKDPLPASLPKSLQKEVDRVKSMAREEAVRYSYEIIAKRYKPTRALTFVRLPDLWLRDLEKIWNKKGHLHCTHMNNLVRILLVKSGQFSDDDIRFRLNNAYYCTIHQYLQVRIGKKWVDLDPWYWRYGLEYGDHAHGFHTGRLFAYR